MSRRRKLAPDEREVWAAVARTAKPMAGRDPFHPPPPPQTPPEPLREAAPSPIQPFHIGQTLRLEAPLPMPERPAPAPLRMDAKTFTKMSRGKLRPESRIDLHGMTLDQAHSALLGYILSCQANGLRLVLVITGKGRGGDDRFAALHMPQGVLRQQVPRWLAMPPLSMAVQQVAQAHATHGGGGALYVYLRRR